MKLIIGGTGDLGTAVTRQLLAVREPVRVMTRARSRAAQLAASGAEVVEGDLLHRDSLERACAGVDAVVATAHSLFGRGRNASAHVDGAGHRTLIDVARDAGVKRFVYTSVYDFDPAYHAVPFFRIKYETEEYLKASGLPFTILRPTAFMESHAHGLIGEGIMRKGKVAIFGRGERPRNFVAAADVARVAVLALSDPDLVGATVAVGGPAHHTNMDVVRIYERATGRTAKVSHVPLGLLRLVSAIARPVHPGISQVVRTGIIADTVDQRFEAPAHQKPLPITFTSLEDWVAEKVGGEVPA